MAAALRGRADFAVETSYGDAPTFRRKQRIDRGGFARSSLAESKCSSRAGVHVFKATGGLVISESADRAARCHASQPRQRGAISAAGRSFWRVEGLAAGS